MDVDFQRKTGMLTFATTISGRKSGPRKLNDDDFLWKMTSCNLTDVDFQRKTRMLTFEPTISERNWDHGSSMTSISDGK